MVAQEQKESGVKVKTITIGVGRTYNIGNFESYRIDGAVEIEYDSLTMDERDAWGLAYGALRRQMAATFREFKPSRMNRDMVKAKFLELKDAKGAPAAKAVIAAMGFEKLELLLDNRDIYGAAFAAAQAELDTK